MVEGSSSQPRLHIKNCFVELFKNTESQAPPPPSSLTEVAWGPATGMFSGFQMSLCAPLAKSMDSGPRKMGLQS